MYLILENHAVGKDVFTDPDLQEVLKSQWTQICEQYKDRARYLVCEIITDPHDIMWAHDDLLFISNADKEERRGDTVLVYSLPDLSLRGKLGGPDVFEIQSAHSVELFPHPDHLVINSSGKVSTYGYELEIENEVVPPPSTYFVEPFDTGFVARDIHYEDEVGYYRLNLYDSDLNLTRELCRKEFEGRAFSG